MANLKDIKRKIKSVENTKKTTRAMKLVSTAKLRRAEMAAKKSKIYANKINEVLSEIAYKINQYKVGGIQSHYFDIKQKYDKVDIIFITADKGLCGGFNVQSIKKVQSLMAEFKKSNTKIRLRAVGRKGVDFFNFQGIELFSTDIGVSSAPTYEKAQEIIRISIEDFKSGATDRVILVHNGPIKM